MAKDTWMKVSGSWKKLKNIWRKTSGTWGDGVISWIKVSGTWKICMEYVADSVSLSFSTLDFDELGVPDTTDYIIVTSSDDWTVALVDTGDGTGWLSASPTFGVDQGDTTFTLQDNSMGSPRSAKGRFTVGTATADVTINQFGPF